ncbi:hypothetical protein ACU4GD_27790 [Cupriavidus basilensis]
MAKVELERAMKPILVLLAASFTLLSGCVVAPYGDEHRGGGGGYSGGEPHGDHDRCTMTITTEAITATMAGIAIAGSRSAICTDVKGISLILLRL